MAYVAQYQKPGIYPMACVGGAKPGLLNLAYAILGDPLPPIPQTRANIVYGSRWSGAFYLGAYNCRRVAGAASLRASAHAEGRALDVGFLVDRPKGNQDGWALAHRLVQAKDKIGLAYVVWAGQQWRAGDPRGWRPYGGASDHHDHIHFEITRQAADALSRSEAEEAIWPLGGGFLMALSDAEQTEVLEGIRALRAHWEDPVAPVDLQEGSPSWFFRRWNHLFTAEGVVTKLSVSAKEIVDELLNRFRG